MDSYLIRIYRRDKKNPEAIIGIIEEIGADKQESFRNLSELTTIISKGNQASPTAMPRQEAKGKGSKAKRQTAKGED